MKRVFRLMILSLLLLQACKKDSMTTSANLNVSGFGPVAFASGDAISIFGSGFDPNANNNTVSFNGVNGEVATATANRLQVIVPTLATSGKITVTVHGQSATSTQTYKIVNVLQGTYTTSFILTHDKQYLLRGNVVFNSKLIIEAGTVIYGEKLSHASLSANDIDFEGTATQPIVFTSDQAPGSRYPGDWTGITIGGVYNQTNAAISLPNGTLQYTRVEYAGYNGATALNLLMATNSIYQYIQTSYSAGGGFSFNGLPDYNTSASLIHHIVAFGCLGTDFIATGTGVTAQFGLGLKDPYFAGTAAALNTRGVGIGTGANSNNTYSPVCMMSNFTLVGYNPDARNILNVGPTLNNDAGSGVQVGSSFIYYGANASSGGNFILYNSVIAASWQAGVNIYANAWTDYEATTTNYAVVIRNNFITGTSPAALTQRAGAFGYFSLTPGGDVDGFFNDISASPQRTTFAGFNDTTKALSFSAGKDDLGIKNLTDYNRLNNPGVLPAAGSPLLNAATFPGPYANSTYFDKDVTYVGAFGTQDWTTPWCNFNPQTTQY